MMPSAYTPLRYGSNWVQRLGQVCSRVTTLLILPPLSLINWLLHACPPSVQLSHLVIRAPHLHDRFVSVRHAHSPARPAARQFHERLRDACAFPQPTGNLSGCTNAEESGGLLVAFVHPANGESGRLVHW